MIEVKGAIKIINGSRVNRRQQGNVRENGKTEKTGHSMERLVTEWKDWSLNGMERLVTQWNGKTGHSMEWKDWSLNGMERLVTQWNGKTGH